MKSEAISLMVTEGARLLEGKGEVDRKVRVSGLATDWDQADERIRAGRGGGG